MEVPTKFQDGCSFWASFSGDEYVKFPNGSIFRLADEGNVLKLVRDLPATGAAPISETAFLSVATSARAFAT